MATKVEAAAAKQRQQKIILIAGGVIFAALLAIQGPKLMKQLKGSKTAAPPVATTPAADGGTGTASTPSTTGGTTTTAPSGVATRGGQSAQVAGVVIRSAGTPVAGEGQLFSLSAFKPKDPFVQQVSNATAGSGTTDGGIATTGTTGATTGTTGTTTTGGIVTPTTSSPTVFAYATLMVNGKPQQLQLKQVFPKGQPTFVLQAVGKNFVKVGVAGGKFTGGGSVKLDKGQTVTLMNTSTGQRFVMKLVFTGGQPEEIAGFKQPTTTPSTGTTTTTTTPTTPTTSTDKSVVSAQTSAYTP